MVCERASERERGGEPEITQVYDVKTKLKGEKEKKEKKNRKRKKGEEKTKSRRRLLRREASPSYSPLFSSFPSDEFLVWARGAHPCLSPPSPPLTLSLSLSRLPECSRNASWRSGCLRGCIHNGTGQNNSRDVFGRVGARRAQPFPTPRRIVSTIKEQRKRHTKGIFEKEDIRGTAKRFQHLGNRFVGTKNLREGESLSMAFWIMLIFKFRGGEREERERESNDYIMNFMWCNFVRRIERKRGGICNLR